MKITFSIKNLDDIEGIKIITPSTHREDRGEIWTSYSSIALDKLLPKNLRFKHDKFSRSHFNVIRGIHGDKKTWKLISCVHGNIFQVVVDMRTASRTFLKWHSFELSQEDNRMILLPPGVGNAFYVKSSHAVYHYKLAYEGEYFDANKQFTVAWNDPRLKINWPTNQPFLSKRDKGIK